MHTSIPYGVSERSPELIPLHLVLPWKRVLPHQHAVDVTNRRLDDDLIQSLNDVGERRPARGILLPAALKQQPAGFGQIRFDDASAQTLNKESNCCREVHAQIST